MCLVIASLALAACSSGPSEEPSVSEALFTKVHVEALPALNMPRGGHQTLVVGDELMVMGGHTDGFKPLETAEYLSKGRWVEVPMLYPHDGGFVTPLQDGRVMLGGGSSESFGIGQSFGVEVYDPATHAFTALGILDRERAYASALELPDRSVLVSGNWYAEDAVGLYRPGGSFDSVKEVAAPRNSPWILPAQEDYLIFGSESSRGGEAPALVDRLYGEAFSEPLLEAWKIGGRYSSSLEGSRVGADTWLLAATSKEDGRLGFLKVAGGVFSVVEVETPLPAKGIDGAEIAWLIFLQTDRSQRLGWLSGIDIEGRLYFACIDYVPVFEGEKADYRLFYAECPEGRFYYGPPLLLSGNRFAVVGGVGQDPQKTDSIVSTNFTTCSEAWLLYMEPLEKAGFPWVLIAGLAMLLVAAGLFLFSHWRRREAVPAPEAEDLPKDESGQGAEIMAQICALIEEKELFRKKDLRIMDIAQELATNKTYVSVLVNSQSGAKFTTLLNGYRIRYAQKLMREHPEMLLDQVADESGFSSRATFFRNFKAQTGMTPKQWLMENRPE